MEPSAQRTGQWLGLEMIVESCPITPHFIAPNLDQPGTQHDAESQPTEKCDDRHRWCAFGKWSHIEQGTKKDCKKSGFEQLYFPSISIPVLPNMNERHIEKPKYSEQWCIRETCQHNAGKQESDPRNSQEHRVGMIQPK